MPAASRGACIGRPFDAAAHSADTVHPMRGLTFVVTAGRSGSTALSQILNGHRDVLSLNEFYVSVRTLPSVNPPLSGEQFWRGLAEPHPIFDAMVRGEAGTPEFIYPRLAGTRFDANTTGIPAISLMTLPHLSSDPDGRFRRPCRGGSDVAATNRPHAVREAFPLACSTFRWECRGGTVGHVAK